VVAAPSRAIFPDRADIGEPGRPGTALSQVRVEHLAQQLRHAAAFALRARFQGFVLPVVEEDLTTRRRRSRPMTLVVSPPIRGAPDTALESILEFARSKVAERLRKIHPMAEIVLNATTVERKDSKTLQEGRSPALTGVCSDQEGLVQRTP